MLPENTTGALDVDADGGCVDPDGGRLFTGDATPLENVEDAEEEAPPAPMPSETVQAADVLATLQRIAPA